MPKPVLRSDIDGDGIIDNDDVALYLDDFNAQLGPHEGGLWNNACAIGYAGSVYDPAVQLALMRNRWYDAELGRWITRDPAGYVNGMSLYMYVSGNPLLYYDPFGLEKSFADAAMSLFDMFSSDSTPKVSRGGPPSQPVDTPESESRELHSVQQAAEFVEASQVVADTVEDAAVTTAVTAAVVAGSFTPVVGEAMDAYVILDPNSTTFERSTAAVSLSASYVTGTAMPNVGLPFMLLSRFGDEAADAGTTAFRYVGESEARFARENGFVPNTTMKQKPKSVFYTPDAPLTSASEAEHVYQLGSTPTHRITLDATNTTNDYAGNVDGASGIEITTRETIPAKAVEELDK